MTVLKIYFKTERTPNILRNFNTQANHIVHSGCFFLVETIISQRVPIQWMDGIITGLKITYKSNNKKVK